MLVLCSHQTKYTPVPNRFSYVCQALSLGRGKEKWKSGVSGPITENNLLCGQLLVSHFAPTFHRFHHPNPHRILKAHTTHVIVVMLLHR